MQDFKRANVLFFILVLVNKSRLSLDPLPLPLHRHTYTHTFSSLSDHMLFFLSFLLFWQENRDWNNICPGPFLKLGLRGVCSVGSVSALNPNPERLRGPLAAYVLSALILLD